MTTLTSRPTVSEADRTAKPPSRRVSFWASWAMVVLGIVAFWYIAEQVSDGDTEAWDESISRALAYERVSGFWQEFGRDLTALGGKAILTLAVLVTAGVLMIKRKFASMILVLVAALGGLVVSLGLKEVFDRPRPDLFEHISNTMTSSFPSGHSMNAAVVWLVLGLLITRFTRSTKLKVFVLFFAFLIPIAVGVSRVFVGVHWMTDVLAGWSLGVAWAFGCYAISGLLQDRRMVEQPEETTDDIAPMLKKNAARDARPPAAA